MKTWQQLKIELSDDEVRDDLTLKEFSTIFLEHCRKKNRRSDYHEEEINRFLPIVGGIWLKQFTRADAARLQEWRARSVAGRTVNRMMDEDGEDKSA